MKKPLNYTWQLYAGSFEKVLLMILFTTLPLLILHSYITNYIYVITPSIDPIYSFADVYYGFLTILFYLFAQVPFIRFVYNEHKGHEHSLRNAFYIFITTGFSVFIFAVILSFLSTLGFMFFVIPGLMLLALAFPIIHISIFDKKSIWQSRKEGLRIGKKHFLKIFLIIVVTGALEWLMGSVVSVQIFDITTSLAAQLLTQMFLNLLIYPFIVLYLTSCIIKWRENQEVLEVNSNEDDMIKVN